MIKTDYLKRIANSNIVAQTFSNGRRFFEVHGEQDATMPVEFSGAAFRFGHSQVRASYEWNKFFNSAAAAANGNAFSGHLFRLFRFSGTSGTMTPIDNVPGSVDDLASLENPQDPGVELPDVWVADFTRLFDLTSAGAAFTPAPADSNHAMAIDARVVDPSLKTPPVGPFGGVGEPDLTLKRSLAFRRMARGRMLGLPSGQEMANALGANPLTPEQVLQGNGGPVLTDAFVSNDKEEISHNTPLWFYVLREAEFAANKNKLDGVGATIVVETIHRAMEKSKNSIVADPSWRPTFAKDGITFGMSELLLFAFDGDAKLLNPHQ